MCELEFNLLKKEASDLLRTSPDNVSVKRHSLFLTENQSLTDFVSFKLFYVDSILVSYGSNSYIYGFPLKIEFALGSGVDTVSRPVKSFASDVLCSSGKLIVSFYSFEKIH